MDRDTTVMTFALLLAVGVAVLAYLLPPVKEVDPPHVVNSVNPVGGRVYALLPAGAPYPDLGLFYHPAEGYLPRAPRNRVSIGTVKRAGLLAGYSLPGGRLAFLQGDRTLFLPPSQMPAAPRVPGIVYGKRNTNRIALTFDDGYSGMSSLLDLLTLLRVPATIFPAGYAAQENPGMIRKAHERGFEIGNHSFSHPCSTRISPGTLASEILAADAAVKKACGTGTAAYFRPPFGDQDVGVQVVAGSIGYLTIMWSRDTLDWSATSTPEQVVARATEDVKGGEIVLMHSQGRYTKQALPTIVRILRLKGFELTTVSGLLQP